MKKEEERFNKAKEKFDSIFRTVQIVFEIIKRKNGIMHAPDDEKFDEMYDIMFYDVENYTNLYEFIKEVKHRNPLVQTINSNSISEKDFDVYSSSYSSYLDDVDGLIQECRTALDELMKLEFVRGDNSSKNKGFFGKLFDRAKKLNSEYTEEIVKTSITQEYGEDIWDMRRIVIDACQNHLPSDSGGNNIFIHFMTTDGQWHDYTELSKYPNKSIKQIKIADDGIGYDSMSLQLFASTKDEHSTGKWGEGLKMLVNAALGNGIEMMVCSRDWIAFPQFKPVILNKGKSNQKTVNRLQFRVQTSRDGKSRIFDDGDWIEEQKSATIFFNPTEELIDEFRRIQENILYFSPIQPIVSTHAANILDLSGGKIYIKGLLVNDDMHSIFSYDLKKFDVESRDRNMITYKALRDQFVNMMFEIDDEQFISLYLDRAVEFVKNFGQYQYQTPPLEFNESLYLPSGTSKADKWIKVFKEKFGDTACVGSLTNMNPNAFHEAQHVGLNMVFLPNNIANALSGLEGQDGQKISSYSQILRDATNNLILVDNSNLTTEEKQVIMQLYWYNNILKLFNNAHPIHDIKVYDYPEHYMGERAGGFVNHLESGVIYIYRKIIDSGIISAGDVFFHEAAHDSTHASDPDKGFRDYLTKLLSYVAYSTEKLKLPESFWENAASEISESEIREFIKRLKAFNQIGQEQYDGGRSIL